MKLQEDVIMAFEIKNGVLIEYIAEDGETSVIIPDNVTSIGRYAFDECKNLTEVKIPDSVTSIGASAFSDCKNLGKVIFSKTVESLGVNAFNRCNIYEITLTENLKTFDPFYHSTLKKNEFKVFFTGNVEQWAKSGLSTLLDRTYSLYIENEPVKDVDLSNLTEIPSNAFYNGASLENVVFSDKTTSIGEKAFYKCESLKSINFGDSLVTIGDKAFYTIKQPCAVFLRCGF